MADDTNRLAGTAYLAANGKNYMVAGDGITYSVSRVERTTLKGPSGVHGYSEEPVAGYIEATLRDAKDLSLADINAMSDASVTIQLANGKLITGANMWTVGAQEVATAEATFSVRWEGFHVEEA